MNSNRFSPVSTATRLVGIAAMALFAGLSSSRAQQITDFNFDSDTLGQPVPTTAPGTDPQPQQTVYATGGEQDDATYTGSVTVQNVGGLNHAAEMVSNQGTTGSNYIDTQFLAPGSMFDISFDIYIGTTPSTGLPQSADGAPNGQAFALNVFDLNENRVMRFAVSPTSGTGGNLGFRLPGDAGDLTTFGTYTNGNTYHVEFQMNYETNTADVLLNNSLVLADAPLVSTGNSGLSELFFFQNGVEGVTNDIALDNIETSAVPEPGTWIAGALTAAALVALRGKRRSSAVAARVRA
jgi:hypothetical protein